jgi:hypothetical protein
MTQQFKVIRSDIAGQPMYGIYEIDGNGKNDHRSLDIFSSSFETATIVMLFISPSVSRFSWKHQALPEKKL